MSWKLELSLPMLTLGLPLSCLLVLLSYPTLPLPAPPVLASSPLLPPQKDGEYEGERGEGSRRRGVTIDFIFHYFMTQSCCSVGHDWILFFFSVTFLQVGRCYLVGYNWCPATSSLGPHTKPQSYVCFVVPHWYGVACSGQLIIAWFRQKNVVYYLRTINCYLCSG